MTKAGEGMTRHLCGASATRARLCDFNPSAVSQSQLGNGGTNRLRTLSRSTQAKYTPMCRIPRSALTGELIDRAVLPSLCPAVIVPSVTISPVALGFFSFQ